MELFLERVYHTAGSNGVLMFADKSIICKTIELPWRNNSRNISCIPEGRYELEKRYSMKHRWHLHLLNVPNRSFILIHAANSALKELEGCIAPVSETTGAGLGIFSVRAFIFLKAIVYPVLEQGEPVYLNIYSH